MRVQWLTQDIPVRPNWMSKLQKHCELTFWSTMLALFCLAFLPFAIVLYPIGAVIELLDDYLRDKG